MKSARPSQKRKGTGRRRDFDPRHIEALCEWFRRNARDLPWRRKRTGYTALVSEAMLQQTQVSRVTGAYTRFMRRFPTVKSLALADEQEVLAMWQGLGYYRRARNLHAAARLVMERFRGRIPSSVDELRQLPGVGRYTAGAIASLVFEQPEPIVDGNVKRVLSRLFGNRRVQTARELDQWSWRQAARLVAQAARPGMFNESLMELGATVCTPSPARPQCDRCPLSKCCVAYQKNCQQSTPRATPRKAPRSVHHHAVIVRNQHTGRVLLEQRPAIGMWSNMWQVPTVESGTQLRLGEVKKRLPISVKSMRKRTRFSHATTHRIIAFHVFHALSEEYTGHWHDVKSIADLPMSNPQRRIVAMAVDIKP